MKITDIENPEFLKDLNHKQMRKLSKDIRAFLIDNVSKTGGHLSSNLGIVELTIALHKVFDSPKDKIFFDVGHQSYTHKILTGRSKQFHSLRTFNGLSGYQKRSESIHDCFEAGHSSTTLSAAAGMAIARDLSNDNYHILPVIGDASLASGIAFEALNNIGHLNKKIILILNDNDMSISKNVGALNNFLDKLRISMSYNKAKQNYKDFMKKTRVGEVAYNSSKKIKDVVKKTVISNLFTDLGFDYIGPIDGHDFKDLERSLNKAKNSNRPIVVHVMTKKGKGYNFAECDKSGKWHGVGKFEPKTGKVITAVNSDMKAWSKVVSDALFKKMCDDEEIVCITPAMIAGSKLEKIFKVFPERSFDVGIAEQHATMMATGLALANKKPFLSIYSTFSQRSYDQFNHDISRMNLSIVIGLDRSGLVGEDGETHHGVFDISLFRALPNFVICAPKNESEVDALMDLGFKAKCPFIIRFPRGETNIKNNKNIGEITIGLWEYVIKSKKQVIISYGNHSENFENLISENDDIGLVHARFIKPLDYELLDKLFLETDNIIVYEPDIKAGGFSSSILEYANTKKYDTRKVEIHAIDDKFVGAGSNNELLESIELDYEHVVNLLKQRV